MAGSVDSCGMIREFNGSDSDYAGYVALKRRVWPNEAVTVSTRRQADDRQNPAQLNRRMLMGEGGVFAGAADFYSLPFSANDHRFGFMVIVDPDERRRGIGTALYEHLIGDADVASASGWETAAYEGEPSGGAWLDHLGFKLANTHQMSELNLATVDVSQYGRVIESVQGGGVALMPLSDYMASTSQAAQMLYDLAIELSRDAPWYEDVAKPPLAQWRLEFIDSDSILVGGFTVAVVDRGMIGQSALMRDAHDELLLRTGLTGVRKAYRRRGIATAMKMRAIEYASTLPRSGQGLRIQTGNEKENPMLTLNLQLGFVPQPAWFIYAIES
jgi:mycothiol synthase